MVEEPAASRATTKKMLPELAGSIQVTCEPGDLPKFFRLMATIMEAGECIEISAKIIRKDAQAERVSDNFVSRGTTDS